MNWIDNSRLLYVILAQAFYTSPLHAAKSTPSLVDSASPEGSLKNKWMNSVDSLDTVSSAASSSAPQPPPGMAKRAEAGNNASEFGKLSIISSLIRL